VAARVCGLQRADVVGGVDDKGVDEGVGGVVCAADRGGDGHSALERDVGVRVDALPVEGDGGEGVGDGNGVVQFGGAGASVGGGAFEVAAASVEFFGSVEFGDDAVGECEGANRGGMGEGF